MKLAAYLAATTQAAIAAGTFLVAKEATALFGPERLIWFRIVLSALLVLTVYALRPGRRPRPPRGDLVRFALLGLTGIALNQGFFLLGIHRTTPLHASLLYSFTPVLVMAGSVLWLGSRPTRIRIMGVALAVVGVALVLTARGLDLAEGVFQGDLIVLLAVAAWAAYTLLGKPLLERYDPFTVIVWAFSFGALYVLPATPWVWRGFDPASVGPAGWLQLFYLSAVTSGIAFTLWYFALRRLDATQVAVFTNLQAPLTAVLVWLVYGALPGAQVLLGGLLVVIGVTVVQLPARRARPPAPPTSR